MSLAQHVTQSEGFDFTDARDDRAVADAGGPGNAKGESHDDDKNKNSQPEWRLMNFAPAKLEHERPRMAAYKVSKAKRFVQVATGIAACWLSAGIVFGFAALKPILVARGVYGELCDGQADGDEAARPCTRQDLRLNLLFVVASVTANVSSLLAGAALDRYGRRACWLAASVALAAGAALLGASLAGAARPGLDGYLAGYVLLALGGTLIFVPSFQLANAFPRRAGLVVALVTGAFDASAAVFLLCRLLHEATGGRLAPEAFFYGYLAVPVAIVAAELAYMPAHGYDTTADLERKAARARGRVGEQETAAAREKLVRIESVAGDAAYRRGRRCAHRARQRTSGVWGVLHGAPLRRQLASPWFLLALLLTAVQMLRMTHLMATVRAQYGWLLGSDAEAEAVNRFFDAALPVGGIVATPVVGLMLDKLSVSAVFGLLTLLAALLGLLNGLRYLSAGYATVVVFVFFRPLYYSAISGLRHQGLWFRLVWPHLRHHRLRLGPRQLRAVGPRRPHARAPGGRPEAGQRGAQCGGRSGRRRLDRLCRAPGPGLCRVAAAAEPVRGGYGTRGSV